MNRLLETTRLDRTAFSVGTHADDDQATYWRGQSYEARMNAIEFLRRAMWGEERTSARLQRVFEVVRTPRH